MINLRLADHVRAVTGHVFDEFRLAEAAHLPGAVYASLDRDLSGAKTGTNGRHPLPDPQNLAGTFGRLGIAGGMQVVAYDQDNGMYRQPVVVAAALDGARDVAVLDSGLAGSIGGPATAIGVETRPPATSIDSRIPGGR